MKNRNRKNKYFGVIISAVLFFASLIFVVGFLPKTAVLWIDSFCRTKYGAYQKSDISQPDYNDAYSKETEPVPTPTPIPTCPPIDDDFKDLYEVNCHIAGWLKAGDRIDYPVVKFDNEFYLTHNFKKQDDVNGAVFINEENTLWPRDDVLLIHGHNMISGDIFGTLRQFENYKYLREHPIINFRTIYDSEDIYYVPIAGFNASMNPDSAGYFDIRKILFRNEEPEGTYGAAERRKSSEYSGYIKELVDASIWSSPFGADENDELILLVTCSYNHDNGRFILACRKLRSNESPEEIEDIFLS